MSRLVSVLILCAVVLLWCQCHPNRFKDVQSDEDTEHRQQESVQNKDSMTVDKSHVDSEL